MLSLPLHSRCRQRAATILMLSLSMSTSWSTAATLSDQTARPLNEPSRLAPYEDSYALWRAVRNTDGGFADEQALRTRISFKYTLCGPQFRRQAVALQPNATAPTQADRDASWCPTKGWARDAELFIGYTGEFDFYAGTRRSGPVIGRLNAPGVYLRLPASRYLGQDWSEADSLEIGLQHRSNGQVFDVSTTQGAAEARERYRAGDVAFFDTISRSSNFIVLAIDKEWQQVPLGQRLTARAKLLGYLGSTEATVSWGPDSIRTRSFSDFDLVNLQVAWRLTTNHLVEASWRVGKQGFRGDSLSLAWEWRLANVPLYLQYHHGPMYSLSNFSQPQQALAFGLKFAGW